MQAERRISPQKKESSCMAETMISAAEGAFADRSEAKHRVQSTPGYQAYRILHAGFVAAPLLAGLDKFFHLLTNWDIYLAPRIAALSPIGGHGLISVVGVVEVCAGVLVALRPRLGAYVVMAWLLAIILNLLLIPGFFDIALRYCAARFRTFAGRARFGAAECAIRIGLR
jgi:hypothetical protein